MLFACVLGDLNLVVVNDVVCCVCGGLVDDFVAGWWFGLVALWYDSLCLFVVICVCFV